MTRIFFRAGGMPRTLQPLIKVSGKTIYAFVSRSPLYVDLSTELAAGRQVANVKALQRALKRAGAYDDGIDGNFDSATEIALEAWQDDQGLSETGSIDITRLVWVPSGGTIGSWKVSIGSKVTGTTQLGTVEFPRPLQAQVLATSEEISALEVGQTATLTIDGHDRKTLAGRVVSISKTPTSTTSGGSSGSARYTVILMVGKLPRYARQGMTGTVSILVKRRKNVLVVPTGAVMGSGSAWVVRVLQDGSPVVRSVTPGLATSSGTEIVSGLAEGEKVVTAVVKSGSTSESPLGGLDNGYFRARLQQSDGGTVPQGLSPSGGSGPSGGP